MTGAILYLIQTFGVAALTGVLGYYLGLKSKKPIVLADRFIREDKKTCFVLKNVGESTALNIKVGDIVLKLSDTLFRNFPQIQDSIALFKFETVDHLASHETKESKCTLTFNNDKNSGNNNVSQASLSFLSASLKDGTEIKLSYKDGFGLRYSTKCILDQDRIITK